MKAKKYLKITIPIIIVICCIIVAIIIFIKREKTVEPQNNENTIEVNNVQEENIENTSNTMIIELNKNIIEENNTQKEPEKPKTKSPAEITQEIYAINGPVGKIRIPRTKKNMTILSNVTVDNMEKSPCFLYTTGGINKKGTTLIVGHNKRNGKLFSDNSKIKKGDKIYITDLDKKTLTYTVYSTQVTKEEDTSFLKSDVDSPEIVLSSCTDDEKERIIIIAKAEGGNY